MKKIIVKVVLVFLSIIVLFFVAVVAKALLINAVESRFGILSIDIRNNTGTEFILTVTMNDTVMFRNWEVENVLRSGKSRWVRRPYGGFHASVFVFELKDTSGNLIAKDELRRSDHYDNGIFLTRNCISNFFRDASVVGTFMVIGFDEDGGEVRVWYYDGI